MLYLAIDQHRSVRIEILRRTMLGMESDNQHSVPGDLTQAFMASKVDLVSGRGIDEDGAVIVWTPDELDRRLHESIRAERFAQEHSE
jgi:hypothetical protein